MEKINKRRLSFINNLRYKLLIMAKLCLLLFFSMTDVAVAVTINLHDNESQHLNNLEARLVSDQQITIKGTVKDASTSDPLPGVTIMVKGTTIGVLSDARGDFSIIVPNKNAILILSFIGYTSQEIAADQDAPINVFLQIEVTQISEVVVVGYGVQKKESVVGAITQVNNESLIKSGVNTVTNAIAGKLSGILTMQQTGEPGADEAEVLIRGLSSWNSSAPLTLVDGVERDYKDLDPNEISTISVLKDASATAVFGARGANGVIIVTTKRGSLGKAKMEFSSSYGIEQATQIPEHISSYTTMSMLNVAYMNQQQFSLLTPEYILEEYRNPSTPLNSIKYPDVNWFDLLTNSFAPTTNANLSIHGGTNFVKYFCSLGYMHEGTLFKAYNDGIADARYWYKRINYRANLDFALTKSTQLSFNMGGDIGIKNSPLRKNWLGIWGTSPSRFPAYYPAWLLEEIPDLNYPDASGDRLVEAFYENRGDPYTWAYQATFERYTYSKVFTDLILDQNLDGIFKGLSFKGKVSLSTYYVNQSLYANYTFPTYRLIFENIGTDLNPWYRTSEGQELYTQPKLDIGVGGMSNNYYFDLYYEMSLNYSNTFGKHNVSGLALFNRQQKNNGTEFPYYNEGLVGRVNYNYSNKYFLEINIGYTGSERFSPSNRFGFFPSAAIGWTISEEPFLKNAVPWITRLKIRYTDGLVGSDYAANRWLYISEYITDSNGNIWEDYAANSSAQWEEAHKRNLGIDLGLKNGFTLNVELFNEYRDKMLLTPQTVLFIVGNSFKDLNLGSLKKHGIEVEAGYRRNINENLDFFVKGMFGFNENRIISKDDLPYAPEYTKAAGKPLGVQVNGTQLTGNGYYTTIDDIMNNPSPISVDQLFIGEYKFLDYNSDGTISASDKFPVEGLTYPPITYSLAGGFSYKGFDFNLLFTGNVGKYVHYFAAYQYEFDYGSWRVQKAQLDYWRPDNQNVNHSTLHYTAGTPSIFNWAGASDIAIPGQYWRNADYVRLKEVYAGYTFNSSSFLKKLGISDFLVYATGNNLWTLTDLIEGDPERSDFSLGYYPQMRSFKFGVKLSF